MAYTRKGSYSVDHPNYYTLFPAGRFEKIQKEIIEKAFPLEKKLQAEKEAAKQEFVYAQVSRTQKL